MEKSAKIVAVGHTGRLDSTGRAVKRALIIGVSGQDGAYLAKLLLEKGYDVMLQGRRYVDMDHKSLEIIEAGDTSWGCRSDGHGEQT